MQSTGSFPDFIENNRCFAYDMAMVKNLAKQAMTTKGQKACYVIDHLVEALAGDPSSSLRRALILVDIDENPGTTQAEIMERLEINKSALNREIDWLFNYGCIMRQGSQNDGRIIKLEICGYSKKALDSALDYFENRHESLKIFLNRCILYLAMEKPTLRDAKIVSSMHVKGKARKQDILDMLYGGPASTDNRAYNKLLEEGILGDA